MNDNNHDAIARRLATAAGHIKAIERMLQEEEVSCIDIVHQIQAVQGALDKAAFLMLEAYLGRCAASVVYGDDVVERERMLKEIASIFHYSNKSQSTRSPISSGSFEEPARRI